MGPTIPSVGGVWSVDMRFDCADAAVIGSRVAEYWSVYTIEVPEDGSYLVTVPGEEDDFGYLALDHCSPGCAVDKGLEVGIRESRAVFLRQGRHQISAVALQVASGHLRGTIELVEPGAG